MQDSSGLCHEINYQIVGLISMFFLRKNDKMRNPHESSCCRLKFLVKSLNFLLGIKCKSS